MREADLHDPMYPRNFYDDIAAVYHLAYENWPASVRPTDTRHAGERYGGVKDPAANIWWIATHIEDVSPEEQTRRIQALFNRGP